MRNSNTYLFFKKPQHTRNRREFHQPDNLKSYINFCPERKNSPQQEATGITRGLGFEEGVNDKSTFIKRIAGESCIALNDCGSRFSQPTKASIRQICFKHTAK